MLSNPGRSLASPGNAQREIPSSGLDSQRWDLTGSESLRRTLQRRNEVKVQTSGSMAGEAIMRIFGENVLRDCFKVKSNEEIGVDLRRGFAYW